VKSCAAELAKEARHLVALRGGKFNPETMEVCSAGCNTCWCVWDLWTYCHDIVDQGVVDDVGHAEAAKGNVDAAGRENSVGIAIVQCSVKERELDYKVREASRH